MKFIEQKTLDKCTKILAGMIVKKFQFNSCDKIETAIYQTACVHNFTLKDCFKNILNRANWLMNMNNFIEIGNNFSTQQSFL
jgi:hypothetical protein